MKSEHNIETDSTNRSTFCNWLVELLHKLSSILQRLRYRRVPHPDIEVRHVENQEELIKWLRVNARLMTPLHSFYRGIGLGLGLAIGTTFILSLLIHLLAQLSLAPLIGDFAKQILDYLETTSNGGG